MRSSSKDQDVSPKKPMVFERPKRFLSPVPGQRSELCESPQKRTTPLGRNLNDRVLLCADGFTVILNKTKRFGTHSSRGHYKQRAAFSPAPADPTPTLPALSHRGKTKILQKMKMVDSHRGAGTPSQSLNSDRTFSASW